MSFKLKEFTYKKGKVLSLLFISSIVLAACGSEQEAANEADSEEPASTEMEKEESEENEEESADAAETVEGAVTLNDGTVTVGEDLPAGRYLITGKEVGNFTIENNEDRNYSTLEILENEEEGLGMGVPNLTLDLIEGQDIQLEGMEETTFTPVKERSVSNVLTTGTWEVGTDVEPGNYTVTTTGEKSGKIMVYDAGEKLPAVMEPIDPDGELGAESLDVELKEGQTVIVSTSPELSFEPN